MTAALEDSFQPSAPQTRIRRLFCRMGMIRAARTADACFSVHVVAFCLITMLLATVTIFDVSNDDKSVFSGILTSNFGALQVSAWQSGTVLSSSSYHRLHATHRLNPPSLRSYRTSKAILHTRLKHLPPSSSSLWVLSPPSAPSSSSNSADTFSESHHDDSFLEEMSDDTLTPDDTQALLFEDLVADLISENNQHHQALLQSFLPREFRSNEESWKSLPLTRSLLENLAKIYITTRLNDDAFVVSLDTILHVVDKEYNKSSSSSTRRRRNKNNAAVVVIDGISFDVAATGDPADEVIAQVLSLAAMYHVPYELTLLLLDMCTTVNGISSRSVNNNIAFNSVLASAKEAFGNGGGWNSVIFPKGFALQPIKEGDDEETVLPRRQRLSGIWSRFVSKNAQQEMRRREAAAAVEAAAADNVEISAIRNARLARSHDEFLSRLHAELSESALPESSTAVALFPNSDDSTENQRQKHDQLVFFPNNVPSHQLSLWKRLRRGVDKSYNLLKKKGRAGFLAYAFFNFSFYSIGLVWQWTRSAPADPFAASTSAALSVLNVCCRKFGRVFAYLLVISNLIKLPKIFISALLLPSAESALGIVQKRLQLSEARACMVLVALLAVLWVGIAAIPITAEYVQLKRLVHLDQIVQSYMIQPV